MRRKGQNPNHHGQSERLNIVEETLQRAWVVHGLRHHQFGASVLLFFEPTQFTSARWVAGPKAEVEKFVNANKGHIAHDHDGDIVYLTRLQWDIDRIVRDHPELRLSATKEMMV